MIDVDKYEGHKAAPWRWFGLVNDTHGAILLVDADDYGLPLFRLNGEPTELDRPDIQLIADAPLLLAEVKRLRKELKEAKDVIQYALEMSNDDDSIRVFEDYLEVIE